jgi:hypothetical protein
VLCVDCSAPDCEPVLGASGARAYGGAAEGHQEVRSTTLSPMPLLSYQPLLSCVVLCVGVTRWWRRAKRSVMVLSTSAVLTIAGHAGTSLEHYPTLEKETRERLDHCETVPEAVCCGCVVVCV